MILIILILTSSAPDTLWANVTCGGVYSMVSIGDIDGDGVPDVVSGEETIDVSSWNSGCFVVMLSNGSVDLKKTITVLN